ncbi:thiamine pyrophosphokinase [Coniochaeta sp. 2T2.1]|nr:thiamine pyrophosphokinase [Coniochaeta sp. 2T2.1]
MSERSRHGSNKKPRHNTNGVAAPGPNTVPDIGVQGDPDIRHSTTDGDEEEDAEGEDEDEDVDGEQDEAQDEEEEAEPTLWYPATLFRKPTDTARSKPDPFSLVILNQPLGHFTALQRLWDNAETHIAADGGANCLYEAGPAKGEHDNLHTIIGDLDSLRDDVRSYFSSPPRHANIIHNPDQYSTDFTKAVEHIRAAFPSRNIVTLGGLGGRVDQGLSQLHHLYMFQKDPRYGEGRVYLVSEESITFLLKSGSHRIRVRDGGEEEVFGKHVGIIPVGMSSRISTKGLEWDVNNWKTEFGGQMSTSNHVLPETEVVEVKTTRDVLFTIAVRQLD